MAMGYGVCVHIVYEHCATSCCPRGQARVNLYRGCAEIERKSCNLRSLQTVIVRSSCGFREEAAWRWCGDRGATVPFLSVRPPRGARAGIVRCHLRHVYGLRTYDFSNLYNFPLNKIVEAAEPVNLYENLSRLLPPHGKAARKGGYGQDMGSVGPSQAKCELGIRGTHAHCAPPGSAIDYHTTSLVWPGHNRSLL